MIQKDVVVIGGGPGGYVAAIRASQLGGEVVLVEQEVLGGTCVSRGCIPTKLLLYGAELLEQAGRSKEFGINVTGITVDFSRLMSRKDAVVRTVVRGVEALMKSNAIEVLQGKGSLVSSTEVAVVGENGQSEHIRAGKIILAPGSLPARLSVPGADIPGVLTSDQVLQLADIPQSMVIIGGGVVGVEFASIFNQLGTKVVILELLPQLVPGEDRDLASILEKALRRNGIEIITGASVEAIEDEAGAGKRVVVTTSEGEQRVSGELVLVAIGRKPNTEQLGLEAARVETDDGRIVVNEKMETTTPGIYAIGDAIGGWQLAHVASTEGVVAAENALGGDSVMDYRVVPRCIHTLLEIAAVGMTEDQAREQGNQIKVGRFPFVANGMAVLMGQGDGFVKIITEAASGKILGAHLFGPRVTELIGEVALAMKMGGTTQDVLATIHPHPTLSEAVREAALDAEGMVIQMPPRRNN